ncbi:MAG: prepilin-type N-terminal cleavage/methylation domain-containing protein [Desulfobacterales bacterium]
MANRKEKKRKGFTLLELVLSVALGLIIITALVSTFTMQRKTYDAQEQGAEMIQTARAALDMIGRELIMAGYNPDPASTLQKEDAALSTFTGVSCSGGQLDIRADLDGDGAISNAVNDNEWIIYKLDGDVIKRKVGNGSFENFAENITAFTFECQDVNGNSTSNTADVRRVNIILSAQTEKPGIGTGYGTETLESVFKIRNMGLAAPSSTTGSTSTTVPTTTTTSSSSTTTTSSTSSTSTTTTTTTSTTTTTADYYIPPDDEIDDMVLEGDECDPQRMGINVEQCTKNYNDSVLIRVFFQDDYGLPMDSIPDGSLKWFINGVEQINHKLTASSTQPGWYGSTGLCNCGTFLNSYSCAVSDGKHKEYTITVEYHLDNGCVYTYETETFGSK